MDKKEKGTVLHTWTSNVVGRECRLVKRGDVVSLEAHFCSDISADPESHWLGLPDKNEAVEALVQEIRI